MKATVFSDKGVKSKMVDLPKEYTEKVSRSLLWQVLHVYRDRFHTGSSKVKTRSEINRTKKKLYRQKGTGGARHGAKSAPIFVGGGVAHGPKVARRLLDAPKVMKKKALNLSIKMKGKENAILVVSGVDKFTKTKEVGEFLGKLGFAGKRIIFAVSEENYKSFNKAARNLKNIKVKPFTGLTAYDVFFSDKLVFDQTVLGKDKK